LLDRAAVMFPAYTRLDVPAKSHSGTGCVHEPREVDGSAQGYLHDLGGILAAPGRQAFWSGPSGRPAGATVLVHLLRQDEVLDKGRDAHSLVGGMLPCGNGY